MSLFGKRKKQHHKRTIKTLSDKKQLSANRAGTYLHTCRKASMTVEAVAVLPIFIGFFVFLLFYFRIMQVQIGIQQALTYTARVTAACAREKTEEVNSAKVRILLMKRIKEQEVPCQYIDRGLSGISLQYSESQKEEISLHISYRMTVPAAFFGKLVHPVEQEVSARKWTGRENADREEKDSYVYVTETGKVYHKNRDCAYLKLTIRAVSAKRVKKLRNKGGERYRLCGRCKKSGEDLCYITDYGGCYHWDISCSGLKRTVYTIPLEKTKGLRRCSKCTGG